MGRPSIGQLRLARMNRLLITSIVPSIFRLLRLPLSAHALPTHLQSLIALHSHHAAHVLEEEPDTPVGSPAYYIKLGVVFCLVMVGGALAGLTLALMSMDNINLTVLEQSGDEIERQRASKVLRLIKKGQHWVLVTLLLFNTITNETLPIFLDSILGGGVWAVISSTALILLFGEIIPQAICSRYGLAIGAASVPFMNVLMYASYPISYPIAVLLDRVLGHDEGVTYRKKELKTFVSLHRHLGAETLVDDEVTIISAVLELSEKSIQDIMVPIDEIYSISSSQILNDDTVGEILRQGYSRVPVHERDNQRNFIGMLLVKNLITYDPEDAKPVSSFNLIPLPEAEPGMSCLEALNFFQQGRSHMMLVTEHPGEPSGALGIVSLEDVIEELIGEEIIDETDLFLDVANKIKVVRRPIIRTGAAKKLTPLLRDVADRRRSKMVMQSPANAQGKNSRANSESEGGDRSSEHEMTGDTLKEPQDSAVNGGLAPSRRTTHNGIPNYGATLQAATSAGVSTPRRRPSNSSRLSDIGALGAGLAGISFDKVKIKGGTAVQRKEALAQVKQSLEAIGGDVIEVVDGHEDGRHSGAQSLSSSPLPYDPHHDRLNGSGITITASLLAEDEGLHSHNGDADGDDSEHEAARSLRDALLSDESAPLLGGKQVVDGLCR